MADSRPVIDGVTVVLPTIDEAGSIEAVIRGVLMALHSRCEVRVVVVDDGSCDATCTIVRAVAEADSRVRLIEREVRDGLAGALRAGVAAATTTDVAWMDADGSMTPDLLSQMWDARRAGADVVVGSRFATGGGIKGMTEGARGPRAIWRNLAESQDSVLGVLLSSFLNAALRTLLRCSIRDYTSGYILCSKETVTRIGFIAGHGEYCIAFLYSAARRGLLVREIPYVITPRRQGYSKSGSSVGDYLERGWPYVRTAWRVRRLS